MSEAAARRLAKRLSDFKKLGPLSGPAEIAALKTLEGEYKKRIHNEGKDTFENELGRYSSGYARKRTRAGRQTAKKDLQFSDQLFNSYGVGVTFSGGVEKNAFGFTAKTRRFPKPKRKESKRRRPIPYGRFAALIESNEGRTIFTPSEDEFRAMARAYFRKLTDVVRKL